MGDSRSSEKETSGTGIESVGEVLRERREQLGLSRHDLAKRLNMGVEQLQALEQGELKRLHEPVFVKAAVRRVASHLELDPDPLVQQLGTIALSAQKRRQRPATDGAPSSKARPFRITAWLGGLGLIAASATWFVLQPELRLRPTATTDQTSSPPPLITRPVDAKTMATEPSTSAPTALTLQSSEPSWIALRRNGVVFFEGNLHRPLEVQDPETVEVYAGRPDLVTVSSGDNPAASIGNISELRWYRLSPER